MQGQIQYPLLPNSIIPGGYSNPLYNSGQQISTSLQLGQSPTIIAQSLMLQQAAQQAAQQHQMQRQQQLAQQQRFQSILQQQLMPQQPFAQPQNVTPSWTMKPCTESGLDLG